MSMRTLLVAIALSIAPAACGGAPKPPPEEEVTAVWGEGDDEVLEQEDGDRE